MAYTQPDKYPERYICFMDILGWKQLTETAKNDVQVFKKIHEGVTRMFLSKPPEYGIAPNGAHISFASQDFEPRVYTFSDHVVLSSPCDLNGLTFLLHNVTRIYGDLLFHSSVCLRGSITKGQLLDDRQVVFGPGLNHAYLLESEIAIYPRILIDKSIQNDLTELILNWNSTQTEPWPFIREFRQDFDGLKHLDILSSPPPCTVEGSHGPGTWGNPSQKLWLTTVRSFLEMQLTIHNNPKILSKYMWFKHYFNQTVATYPEFTVDPLP